MQEFVHSLLVIVNHGLYGGGGFRGEVVGGVKFGLRAKSRGKAVEEMVGVV